MKVDYTTYSLKDLLDVKSRIDVERFPENYEALIDEIERRRRSGNLHGNNTDHLINNYDYDDDDDEEDLFFLDFKPNGNKKRRRFVICAALIITAWALLLIGKDYWVTSLDEVRKYDTTVSSMKCVITDVENEETDEVRRYIDLDVMSDIDRFTAFDISQRMCNTIKSEYPTGSPISIWHKDGIIYQLKSDERMLLSYRLLKSRIRAFQTQDMYFYIFGLLFFWALAFKTVINAISPGTFTKED